MSFVHLHCHTSFSFHAGVPGVPDYVGRAKDLGMPALAITDTDRMSGLILHYQACRQEGIQPILGVELTEPLLVRSNLPGGLPTAARADAAGSCRRERLVLLARNAQGYADLCDILTQRHLSADTFRFEDVFARPWPDLVLITASPGLLGTLAATPNRPNLYGELVNHSAATRRQSHHLEAVASALQVPVVATNDCYFLDRAEWTTHQVLTAIGLNSTVSRLREGECAAPGANFRTAAQMQAAFPSHPQALANAERIAEDCGSIELDLGTWIMPRIEVPGGATPESHLAQLALGRPRAALRRPARIQPGTADPADGTGDHRKTRISLVLPHCA